MFVWKGMLCHASRRTVVRPASPGRAAATSLWLPSLRGLASDVEAPSPQAAIWQAATARWAPGKDQATHEQVILGCWPICKRHSRAAQGNPNPRAARARVHQGYAMTECPKFSTQMSVVQCTGCRGLVARLQQRPAVFKQGRTSAPRGWPGHDPWERTFSGEVPGMIPENAASAAGQRAGLTP